MISMIEGILVLMSVFVLGSLCGRYEVEQLDLKELEVENAKLRRLCGTFWAALKGDPEDRWSEDECPLVLCEHMFDCEDECVFEREMHELGIKVADD